MQGLQGPQAWRVLLLLKGQCILYRRYGSVLEPFKYAGYPMLFNAITVDKDDNNFLSSDRASLLVAASELTWLTYTSFFHHVTIMYITCIIFDVLLVFIKSLHFSL